MAAAQLRLRSTGQKESHGAIGWRCAAELCNSDSSICLFAFFQLQSNFIALIKQTLDTDPEETNQC